MKRLDQGFKNVATYAAGMEQWVNKSLFGEPLQYTFVNDFAIADWIGGKKGVIDTYKRVRESWLSDYKAFTEVAIAVNMLAWAHNQLKEQGFEGRDTFIELYSDLYHQAVSDYYEKYEGDEIKCDYFFEMTD